MEVTMKMYNGGDRFQGYVSLSIPGHDNAVTIRWNFDAPAQSFFEVPIVLAVAQGQVSTRFPEDILRQYPKRGVIWINPSYKGEIPAHVPIAKTEPEAEEKGKALWDEYLDDVCKKWYAQCEAVRAAGGAPIQATGFTKRALKLRNLPDPGAASLNAAVAAASQSPDVAALSKTVQELKAQLEEFRSTKKLREEADKESEQLDDLEMALEGAEPKKPKK